MAPALAALATSKASPPRTPQTFPKCINLAKTFTPQRVRCVFWFHTFCLFTRPPSCLEIRGISSSYSHSTRIVHGIFPLPRWSCMQGECKLVLFCIQKGKGDVHEAHHGSRASGCRRTGGSSGSAPGRKVPSRKNVPQGR